MAQTPQIFQDVPWTQDGGGTGVPFLPMAQQAPAVFAAAPNAGDAPPPLAKLAMQAAAPVFSAPPEPDVMAKPSPVQAQIGETSQRLQALQHQDADPYGSPDNHPGIGGKILHGLSVTGNILGDTFLPGPMSLIPGTQLNRKEQENTLSSRLQGLTTADADDQEKQAQTKNLDLQPQLKQAQLALAQEKQNETEGNHKNKDSALLAKAGLTRDADGNVVADEQSPAYQSLQIHDAVAQSRAQLLEAEEEVKRASNDPNSPAYRLAVSKANTARVNAGAAAQRAQAYYGTYLQKAYNTGLDGQTLAGAPQIEDGAGNVSTVGSTNAGQAVKSQQSVAMFNDVHGALDGLETAARTLAAQNGGSLNSPAVIYALQHAHGTPSEFVQSLDKANLNPAERAYVLAVQAAHENVQALRKSAGGTATDAAVEKLDQLVPNGTTPDLNYLLGQTNQIRQTAVRLGQGVTTVKGGTGVRGGHANQGGAKTPSAGPKAGDVEGGYLFKGGDPGKQQNWVKQ